MDLLDVISSVGEKGADKSWWEALTGLNTGIDWEGLFSGIDLSSLGDIESLFNLGTGGEDELNPYVGTSPAVGGTGSSYETGEGLPGEEAAAGSQGGSGGTGNIISPTDKLKGLAKTFGLTDEAGKINPAALLGLTALLSMAGQGSRGTPAPSGYQGSVPKYTAVRERVDIPQDPNRRPGAGGRRYFSDVSYVAPGTTPVETQAAIDAARTTAKTQAATLKPALYPVPQVKAPEQEKTTEVVKPSPASGVAQLLPMPKYDEKGNVIAAGGGLMGMAKGRYLDGPTDGMEDKIPATISGKQPARLSHGEFVVPADVVSHLGNGNSNAGAQRLYDMMDRIRKARTGNSKQGKQINPNKYLPK